MIELLNELDILRDVSDKLECIGIQYMLTGSLAMNFYATPRMTRDIDIVVSLNIDDSSRILSVFEKDYYTSPEAINEALRYFSTFNIIHNESLIKFDFIIKKNEEYRKTEFVRKIKIKFHDFYTFIVSKEDLIISKFFWARDSLSEMQFSDIRNLLKT